MAVQTILSISIAVSVLTAAANRVALAEPVSLETGVSDLLALGEHYSPRSLASARTEHERLSNLPGYDARVGYAYALVLIKQRSNDEALKTLDLVLAQQPDLLPAWRAKVWAQMSAHKYAAAIHSMQTAATAMVDPSAGLAVAGATDDAYAQERAETACFFGRIFGFLEGSCGHAIAPDELRKSKQRVQSKLGADRGAFSEGEEAIAAQFGKTHERQLQSELKASAQHAEQESLIKQRQQQVDKAEFEVALQSETLQTSTKTQLDDLVKQAESIQKNIMEAQFRLNAVDQAVIFQRGLASVQNAILSQRGQGLGRVGAAERLYVIQNNLQQLLPQQSSLAMQVAGLSEQLRVVVVRRTELLGQGAQAAADLQTQGVQLKRKEKELDRAQKAAAKRQVSSGPKPGARFEQRQTFGSYEPFPFGAEKERVLNWFRQ